MRRPPFTELGVPAMLRATAFYGLAGDVVRLIAPETEGDPAALLLQFLAAFGFAAGRGAYYQVEADQHYPNLFVVIVGDTAKARKGTTWGWILKVFGGVKEWPGNRVKTGLSSGEGFIEQVSGSPDKRLLIFEGEFASVLHMLMRTGNTLSAQLRNAWDGKPLSILTKQAPATATDGHISTIGHITAGEVRRLLGANEMGNGFANRFLWCYARRSRILPDGGNLPDHAINPLIKRIGKAVRSSRRLTCRIAFDTTAHARWCEVYEYLSEGKPGLRGAVTSRGEAQVIRLALIYALLDECREIRLEHLEAALAVWDYCEASASVVFGDALGDPTADEILRLLRRSAGGVTRTVISDHFKRHRTSDQIDAALALLESRELARKTRDAGGAGRPAERWEAIREGTNEATPAPP